jgi:hypothetical protein
MWINKYLNAVIYPCFSVTYIIGRTLHSYPPFEENFVNNAWSIIIHAKEKCNLYSPTSRIMIVMQAGLIAMLSAQLLYKNAEVSCLVVVDGVLRDTTVTLTA